MNLSQGGGRVVSAEASRRAVGFRWSVAERQPLLTERLAADLKISDLLAQCIVNRGLSEPALAANFLQPRLKQLSDPFLLPNMTAAVDRLFRARDRGESLVIFGDYDVDGVSSTALLTEVLSRLGWKVNHYLPDRFDEGYGLSQDGVENCLRKFPATLLLAVDCGSTAVATIDWLHRSGVEVLVLDHHQVSNPAPPAVALVNPWFGVPPSGGAGVAPEPEGGTSDGACFTELCSVGLAFKLAHAIVKRGRDIDLAGAR